MAIIDTSGCLKMDAYRVHVCVHVHIIVHYNT